MLTFDEPCKDDGPLNFASSIAPADTTATGVDEDERDPRAGLKAESPIGAPIDGDANDAAVASIVSLSPAGLEDSGDKEGIDGEEGGAEEDDDEAGVDEKHMDEDEEEDTGENDEEEEEYNFLLSRGTGG